MDEKAFYVEHSRLVEKKFRQGLTDVEEARLQFIRDEFDKIDPLNNSLKELEKFIGGVQCRLSASS